MYRYRRLSQEQQREFVAERRLANLPLHEPHHPQAASQTYFITAANFNHAPILDTEQRRMNFQEELLAELLAVDETEIGGWCILPNHYHLLIKTDLEEFRQVTGRLHNGTSTRWNREDDARGRRVWFRFNDRGVRSERHLQVCLNYIHANPVKHRYVRLAHQWPSSSYGFYLQQYGAPEMRRLWREFPVLDFGKTWDD